MSPPWRECLSVSLALVVFVNIVLARPNDVDPHLYCAGCQATLKEISKKLSGTPAKESHVMEAMENICTPENFVSYEYSPPRSIRACRALMDEHEDAIEKAFTQRKQNMEQYICYEISKACEGVDMSGKTQTSDIDLTGGAAIDGVKSSGLGDDIRVGNVNVGGDEIKVENMKVQSEPEEEEEEEDIPEPDLKTEDGWEDAKLEDIEGEIDLMKTSPVVNVANHEMADKKEEKKEDTTDKKEENKEDTTDKKEEQSSPAKSDVNKVEEKTEEASLTAEKEAEPKQVNADKKKKKEIQKKKKKKGGQKVTKKSSKRSKRMSRKQRKRLALKKKQQRRRKLRKQYRKAKKAARKSKKSKKSKKQKRKTHKKKIVKVEANDKAKEEVKEKKEGEKVEEKSMMVEVSPEKVEKEAEKVEIEAEQVAEKSNKEPGVKISEEKKADANEQLPSEQVKEEL